MRNQLRKKYNVLPGEILKTANINIVPNGSMELDSGWANYNLEGGETNERSSAKAYSGLYSRHIIVDGTGEGAISNNFNVISGKTYKVSCRVWVVSGIAKITRNSARLDFSILSTTTEQWEYLEQTSIATVTGVEALRLETSGAGGEYYVDDVKIVEVGFDEEEIGNFEDVSEWTVTGTGAILGADTINFSEGVQGMKITSVNAVNAYAISPAGKYFDFSEIDRFDVDLYIDDVTKMFQNTVSLFSFYTGTSDLFTYSIVGSKLQSGLNKISFSKEDCAVAGGSPDWNNPVNIRVRALSLSGQTVNLTVDNFRVGRYNRAKVIITFDDANETDYSVAFPYMQALGLRGVCFCPDTKFGLPNQLTLAQAQEMYSAGWEMGNHSHSHVNLTTLTDAQIKEEIRLNAEFLISNGMPSGAYFLAWPFSALNDATVESVREAGIICARTGNNDINSNETTDYLRLHRGSIANTITLEQMKAYIDSAIKKGGVLILNFHDIVDPASETTDILPDNFNALMDYVSEKIGEGLLDNVTFSEWYNGLKGTRRSVTR